MQPFPHICEYHLRCSTRNFDIALFASIDSGSSGSYQNACGSPSKTISRASSPARRKARCRSIVPLNSRSRPLVTNSVGGIPFETTTADLGPGDLLVLYTDGLVETRHHPIDDRLDVLLSFLDAPQRPLEEICDLLLYGLRHPEDHDDVALLVARAQ